MLEFERVRSLLSPLLTPGQTVVAGLSGGADSVAMTVILQRLGYRVIAVHVDHGLRGSEARRDARFVRDFCRERGLEAVILKLDVTGYARKNRLSAETAARILRYRALDSYAAFYHAPVCVAHHRGDQAETVLMHLLRGSGLTGLCGMALFENNRLRPLLPFSRAEIEDFNRRNGLSWVTDSTNLASDCTRNRVRLQLLPQAERIFPGAEKHLADTADTMKEYRAFIEEKTEQAFREGSVREGGTLFLRPTGDVPVSWLLRRAYRETTGSTADLEKKHLTAILSLPQPGRKTELPHGVTVTRLPDGYAFETEPAAPFPEVTVRGDTDFLVRGRPWVVRFLSEKPENVRGEVLDADRLPSLPLTVRARQSGDRFHPLGAPGGKTVKKYMIDKKIPSPLREGIPLLVKDSRVLAFPGHGVDNDARLTEQTKNFLYFGEKL